MTVESLGQLITGQIGMDQLSGPVGVVDTVNTTYEASRSGGAALIIINLLRLTILLSANLGVMNLLPIPALDGARLVFLLVELVRKTGSSGERRVRTPGRNGTASGTYGICHVQ